MPRAARWQAGDARRQEAKLSHADLAGMYRTHIAAEPAEAGASWQEAMADYSGGRYSEAIAVLNIQCRGVRAYP